MTLTIEIVDPPLEFEGQPVQIVLVNKKKQSIPAANFTWQIEIEQKPNRAGELYWSGDTVQHHGDGRRFVYFAWINSSGNVFRRLKVDLNHITKETQLIKVAGKMKDNSPACATAKLL